MCFNRKHFPHRYYAAVLAGITLNQQKRNKIYKKNQLYLWHGLYQVGQQPSSSPQVFPEEEPPDCPV